LSSCLVVSYYSLNYTIKCIYNNKYNLVFVFIHFASSQSLDLCPVGCPVACLQPNDTVGLEVVGGLDFSLTLLKKSTK